MDEFEWDVDKDIKNQEKHGVSFELAQYAFLDPRRLFAEDQTHSDGEKRYYCFGRVKDGILTVRFTHRAHKIRIIGAGFWRKGRKVYETQS